MSCKGFFDSHQSEVITPPLNSCGSLISHFVVSFIDICHLCSSKLLEGRDLFVFFFHNSLYNKYSICGCWIAKSSTHWIGIFPDFDEFRAKAEEIILELWSLGGNHLPVICSICSLSQWLPIKVGERKDFWVIILPSPPQHLLEFLFLCLLLLHISYHLLPCNKSLQSRILYYILWFLQVRSLGGSLVGWFRLRVSWLQSDVSGCTHLKSWLGLEDPFAR